MSNNINNVIYPKKLAYRVDEFCKAVGIGRSTFYKLVKVGDINTVKLGKITIVPEKEIQRLLYFDGDEIISYSDLMRLDEHRRSLLHAEAIYTIKLGDRK